MSTTLKAVHLVNEGSYLVQRGGHTLEVDGIPVTSRQFVVSDPLRVLRVTRTPSQIVRYLNGEGKEKSILDFEAEKRELLKNAEEVEYGEYEFPDLDSEFAFRKFLKEWCPSYGESKEERTPVEFEVTEVRTESGDPFIKSLWNSPHMETKSNLYSLDRNSLSVCTVKEVCENYNLDLRIPGHSGARFSQINGKYLFSDSLDFGKAGSSYIGTLEQCKGEKERIVNHIHSEIGVLVAKGKKAPLNDTGRVHDELTAIYALALKVTSIQETSSSLSACRSKIKALLDDLSKELLSHG